MSDRWRDALTNLGVLLLFLIALEGLAVQSWLVIQAELHSPPVVDCSAPKGRP